MGNKSAFCISSSEAQASEIINQLRQVGFSNNDISALLPDRTGTKDFAHVHHTKAPEGATVGGIVGAILCGGLGWLAGLGVFTIPGLAPYFAAGPIMTALSAAAVGGVVGGLVGSLIGFGVPEYEAKRYTGKVKQGNILISVHCARDSAARYAKDIFEKAGANDIAVTAEASVKDTTPIRSEVD